MQKYSILPFYIIALYSLILNFSIGNLKAFQKSDQKLNINKSFFKRNFNDLVKPSIKNKGLISEKKDLYFKDLQESNQIKKNFSIGKVDPFAMDSEFSIKKNIKRISLLGIVSNGIDNFALIKYKEKIGSLEIGQIGGETTNLLPKDVKLTEILINKSEIIIEFKEEKYKLSIY